MSDFSAKRGSLNPKVEAVLKQGGSVIDLTGYSVTVVLRNNDTGTVIEHAVTVLTPATAGHVRYTPEAGDRDEDGDWRGEWKISSGSTELVVPDSIDEPYFTFRVIGNLVEAEDNTTPISIFYTPLRHYLKDSNPAVPNRYPDMMLLEAVRTMIFMGKLAGYQLTANRMAITPAITDPNNVALLIYETMLSFVAPNPSRKSARSRAFSTSVGDMKDFIRHCEDNIASIKNGSMFSGWQSFRSWSEGITGVDLWAHYSEMTVQAPFYTYSLNASGQISGA